MLPHVHNTHISVAAVTGVTGVDWTTGGILFTRAKRYLVMLFDSGLTIFVNSKTIFVVIFMQYSVLLHMITSFHPWGE
jgi:hypothetical protein